ncbi:MAG: aminoacetone oxidase family FAD-binding enzyme [Clostridia bacterium]|nr:aminoacetone oxidase family FAD-binding enzyme [Clostridia bacterium]
MEKFDLVIVGGGFSSLVLANALKLKNKKVAIFEKLDRVGKKILSTGNGRGNITNKNLGVEYYHGKNPEFCEYAIKRYDNFAIRSFFSNLGLMFATEDDKIYPASMQANSILDALRFNLENSGIEICLNSEVKGVKKQADDFLIALSNGKEALAKNVVLAFGGSSQKQFGTDGSAFSIAKSLGHSVTKLYPSLVQMRSRDEIIKGLKGIRSNAKVTLLSCGKEIKSTIGDLLFTDSGISGNATFYLSSYLSEVVNPTIRVEFIPEITENRLIDHLLYKKQCFPNLLSSEILNGIIHKQIGKNILKSVSDAKLIKDLSRSEIIKIAKIIKNFDINITGTLGFDYSQVTHGGVLTSEFDNKTFESKIVKNLYGIGELLDIDGDCGGFNLQWAFSSAMCVAENLNAKIK